MNELEYLKNSENKIITVDTLNKKTIVLFAIFLQKEAAFWQLLTVSMVLFSR